MADKDDSTHFGYRAVGAVRNRPAMKQPPIRTTYTR